MSIEIKELLEPNEELNLFMLECKQLNFVNNISLDVMHFYKVIEEGGWWWAIWDDNSIIGIYGTRPFRDGYKVWYRAASIESKKGHGLSFYQRAWQFDVLEYDLKKVEKDKNLYIFANKNNPNPLYNRTGKMFPRHVKEGFLEKYWEEHINGFDQLIGLVNRNNYETIRRKS